MSRKESETDSRRLSHYQYYLVHTLIKERFSRGESLPTTFTKYAPVVTEEVGFDVAPATLASICAEEGISSKMPKLALKGKRLTPRVKQLEKQVVTQEARLDNIELTFERWLHNLEARLDDLQDRIKNIQDDPTR